MAKTRLVSRTEELDLAYRIVTLRARFQSLLFMSRAAVLEALRWFGERDDREASSESRTPFGGDRHPRHFKAMEQLVRLARRMKRIEEEHEASTAAAESAGRSEERRVGKEC